MTENHFALYIKGYNRYVRQAENGKKKASGNQVHGHRRIGKSHEKSGTQREKNSCSVNRPYFRACLKSQE